MQAPHVFCSATALKVSALHGTHVASLNLVPAIAWRSPTPHLVCAVHSAGLFSSEYISFAL